MDMLQNYPEMTMRLQKAHGFLGKSFDPIKVSNARNGDSVSPKWSQNGKQVNQFITPVGVISRYSDLRLTGNNKNYKPQKPGGPDYDPEALSDSQYKLILNYDGNDPHTQAMKKTLNDAQRDVFLDGFGDKNTHFSNMKSLEKLKAKDGFTAENTIDYFQGKDKFRPHVRSLGEDSNTDCIKLATNLFYKTESKTPNKKGIPAELLAEIEKGVVPLDFLKYRYNTTFCVKDIEGNTIPEWWEYLGDIMIDIPAYAVGEFGRKIKCSSDSLGKFSMYLSCIVVCMTIDELKARVASDGFGDLPFATPAVTKTSSEEAAKVSTTENPDQSDGEDTEDEETPVAEKRQHSDDDDDEEPLVSHSPKRSREE
jgi:hypothetical protein